jgi:hypothetical protein
VCGRVTVIFDEAGAVVPFASFVSGMCALRW